MRRNAMCLAASLLILVTLTGCGLFGKKKPDAQTPMDTADTYSPPAEEEPLRTYDPYTADTSSYAAETTPTGNDDYYAAAPTTTAGTRYHTVVKSDTLYRLARVYYNDQSRWKDIFEANRSLISDPNKIRIGQRLMIP